jgi:hypothetical protein
MEWRHPLPKKGGLIVLNKTFEVSKLETGRKSPGGDKWRGVIETVKACNKL